MVMALISYSIYLFFDKRKTQLREDCFGCSLAPVYIHQAPAKCECLWAITPSGSAQHARLSQSLPHLFFYAVTQRHAKGNILSLIQHHPDQSQHRPLSFGSPGHFDSCTGDIWESDQHMAVGYCNPEPTAGHDGKGCREHSN